MLTRNVVNHSHGNTKAYFKINRDNAGMRIVIGSVSLRNAVGFLVYETVKLYVKEFKECNNVI